MSRIIPAYAGSTAPARRRSSGRRDHPRIRGEHASGAGDDRPRSGIIPAYAGSTSRQWSLAAGGQDHPRIRGEHNSGAAHRVAQYGSSPHTRGAPARHDHRRSAEGIIPAYAGSTPPQPRWAWERVDHPRIRGEHSAPTGHTPLAFGSSPHTRGAPVLVHIPSATPRIIPAYAGSTRSTSRVRRSLVGSSPHTRGARHVEVLRHLRQVDHPRIRGEHDDVTADGEHPLGIIPAYAGSTPCSWAACPWVWDHPRIRGEHEGAGERIPERCGSSPHTRGARPPPEKRPGLARIIPAYAGSTWPRR